MSVSRRWWPLVCVGAALSIAVSSPCSAATVQVLSGRVSINHGQGFAPISGETFAAAGDTVLVGPGASAIVIYDDGCQQNVVPGSVVTVSGISPCNTASVQPGLVLGTMAVAGGVGAAIILSSDNNHQPASP